jgi:hypothetical protein
MPYLYAWSVRSSVKRTVSRSAAAAFLVATYGTACAAVLVGVYVGLDNVLGRVFVGICGAADLTAGVVLVGNIAGVSTAVRDHGLVYWVKPPWVRRSWAQVPPHFAVLSKAFGGLFAIYGAWLVALASLGTGSWPT